MLKQNTRAELNRLLQARNEYPETAAQIDAEIYQSFAQTCAILVLDMSGFSRLTLRYGIIPFLASLHRLTAIATPIVKEHGGSVIKLEADNIFAVFPQVTHAVDASTDILRCLFAVNIGLPDELDLYSSIGIGYGEVLMVADEDLYGSEMNLACKLGEDLAQPGEILLTESAFAQVDPGAKKWEKLEMSVSGLELIVYKTKLTTV